MNGEKELERGQYGLFEVIILIFAWKAWRIILERLLRKQIKTV
jgi:hypothetical protein